jgi:hypothetical protein
LDSQEFNHIQDKNFKPDIIAAQRLNILFHYPQEREGGSMSGPLPEKIDHSIPWDFLDGASQNSIQSCGRVVIFSFRNPTSSNLQWALGMIQITMLKSCISKLFFCFLNKRE